MTEKQRKFFYFPAWHKCAKANDWVMVKGRLLANVDTQREEFDRWPEPAREQVLKVLNYADKLAWHQNRSVTAEDLRHACNIAAAAKQSSDKLDNKETNRVVVLFQLLADPDDLNAVMDWEHPENVERKSFVAFLKKRAKETTIVAISKRAFKTIFWEDLELGKLRWLAKTLKGREKSYRAPVREAVYAGCEPHGQHGQVELDKEGNPVW
jgi:hypothetical protein